MVGIDTNILVRYIVDDDPKQSKLATHLLEKTCSKENPGFINHIVLCELVWVLGGAYKVNKAILMDVLKRLLESTELSIESPEIAWAALGDFSKGQADYSDYLITHRNKSLGCSHTFTFDKKAAAQAWSKLLE